MAPEMAAAYVAGLIPATLVAGAHLLLFRKKVKAPSMILLQRNLEQVGMYWSESRACIRGLDDGNPIEDETSYMKGLKMLGLVCIALSWVGVFFHLIVLLSLRYLAVPRLEQALLRSKLVSYKLPRAEVMSVLVEIQARVLNAKIPGI